MSALKQSFIETLQAQLDQTSSSKNLPKWICNNTRDPRNPLKPWSFDEHEFQIEIIKSSAPKQSVIKCSQIGLSEVNARKGLALAYLNPGINLIYTLPSGSFAGVFAKTRVSPVIKASKVLNAVLDKDTDNTKIKQIGSSFIYFQGTFSESSAISIPASVVIADEVDFSNQDVLSDYTSRLGHEKANESQFIKFSTPTIEGYAISAEYAKSSQATYTVRCEHCNHVSTPDFLTDVVVPGLGLRAEEVNKHHVMTDAEAIKGAYCECQKCKKDLFTSLINPSRREWVHAFPSKQIDHEGFRVSPLDVPTINPPHRTLLQLEDYKTEKSWLNFKLGQTCEASDTRFDSEIVDRVTKKVLDGGVYYGRCVAGLDVGKREAWLSIAVPHINAATGDLVDLEIVKLEVIDSTALPIEQNLGQRVLQLMQPYGVRCVVSDSAPDFSTPKTLINGIVTGEAFGCYYVGPSSFNKRLEFHKADKKSGVVAADRTGSLDNLCEMWNANSISLPKCQETERVKRHLAGVRRVELEGDERWVKLSNMEDHWVHSFNYLQIAAMIYQQGFDPLQLAQVPGIGKAKVGYIGEK